MKVSKAAPIQDRNFSYFAPLLLFIVLLLCIRAQAQNLMQQDGPLSASGPGCPGESVNITFTPDMSAFSVLFDRMQAQPSPMTQDLKKCEISVPVYVEPGYRLRIAQIDHRGYQVLSVGDTSQFVSRFFWNGSGACGGPTCARSKSIALIKEYSGPLDQPLFETMRGDQKWEASPCGGSMRLEIETSVSVTSKDGGSFLQLDSLDASLSANSIYHLSYERCAAPGNSDHSRNDRPARPDHGGVGRPPPRGRPAGRPFRG